VDASTPSVSSCAVGAPFSLPSVAPATEGRGTAHTAAPPRAGALTSPKSDSAIGEALPVATPTASRSVAAVAVYAPRVACHRARPMPIPWAITLPRSMSPRVASTRRGVRLVASMPGPSRPGCRRPSWSPFSATAVRGPRPSSRTVVGSRGGALEIADHRDPESTVKSRRETSAVNTPPPRTSPACFQNTSSTSRFICKLLVTYRLVVAMLACPR